jgi:MFS family permease
VRGLPILLGRAIYGISWFFLSPYLPYLVPQNMVELVPFSFFATAAIMQIPAGIISTRLGMKRTYSLGLIIMGLSDALIGFTRNPYLILFLYSLTGFGASFFFSSAGGTLAVINEGRITTVMGLYNAMFSVGGIIGLNWGFLDELLGFTYASAMLGIMTLSMGLVNLFYGYSNVRPDFRVIKDKRVSVIALLTAGVWGSFYVVSEYFPSFSYYFFKESSINVSSISSVLLFSSFIGGLASRLAENRVKQLVTLICFLGVIPVLALYTSLYYVGLVVMGVFNEMAISLIYSLAVNYSRSVNSSVSLALVNAIQIGVGMTELLIPVLVGYFTWFIVALVSSLPLIGLLSVLKR